MADDQSTSVDIESLEDFQSKLADLLESANTTQDLARCCQPSSPDSVAFGTFPQALAVGEWHTTTYKEFFDGVLRLTNAIEAAHAATSAIIAAYQTTEERNTASANEIGQTFDDQESTMEEEL